MVKYTFSRFVYFDTNIISHLAKNEHLWPKLFEYFTENGLTMGVGGAQIAELSDAKKIHERLTDLFLSVPTGIIKNWDEIIKEEISAYPNDRSESLLTYPLNAIIYENSGRQKLFYFLSSNSLVEARKDQLHLAKQMPGRHTDLKKNFPPPKTGKYIREQADKFSDLQVIQWLTQYHKDFIIDRMRQQEKFNTKVFLSVRLFGYVIFYKYYLGQREPKRQSDFGDLFHLFQIPYCEIVVMERDLCNLLNQIKLNHPILESKEILNIEFLKRLA